MIRLLRSCGIVADHEEAAVARYHPQVAHFQAEAEEFDIIVQVSDYLYDRGGMWYAIDLGMEEQIRTLRENEMAMDLILLGIVFFMGSYHLAIYVLHRREKVTLYFAIGCLIGALRLFVVNDMFILNLMPDATVPLITAMIYFTYYGGVSVLTLYLRELYPDEISLKVTKVVMWVSSIFMLTVLLLPLHVYTHMIRYYHFL